MLEKLIARIPDDTRHRLERARHDAWLKRNEGRVALWSLSTRGLERAHELLDDAPPALAQPLIKLVNRGLAEATQLPVEGYDQLNARKAAAAVRGLDLLDLERVARVERSNKNRKTVLDAVQQQRKRLLAEPEPEA